MFILNGLGVVENILMIDIRLWACITKKKRFFL
jgi:hypothetical protein